MSTITLTIKNDFHNTEVKVRAKRRIHHDDEVMLSPSQVKRIRRVLCGMHCTCGGFLSERGHQEYEDLFPLEDGGCFLYADRFSRKQGKIFEISCGVWRDCEGWQPHDIADRTTETLQAAEEAARMLVMIGDAKGAVVATITCPDGTTREFR
jgi:hypothetical protein